MSSILRSFPTHLSKDVPLDTDIEVGFFRDLNIETVTINNIMLLNVAEQRSEKITLHYKNRVLKITPRYQLSPETHYKIEIVGGNDQGIRDITGEYMIQSYHSEFFTGKQVKVPTPRMISPVDLSEITGDIKFSWTPVDVADNYQLQISKSNTFDVLLWPPTNHYMISTEVIPDIKYEKNIQYYARLRAIDAKGVASAFTETVRYFYSGVDEQKPSGDREYVSLDYVKDLTALGGEMLFTLEKPYKPGIGQLTIHLNGLVVKNCSSPSLKDGEYREVDERTVILVDPLEVGDTIRFTIEGALKEEVEVERQNILHEKSELALLQEHFAGIVEVEVKHLKASLVSPKNGAVMVPDITRTIVNFSEPIDPSSINTDTLYFIVEKN